MTLVDKRAEDARQYTLIVRSERGRGRGRILAREGKETHSKLCDSNPSLPEYQSDALTTKPLTTREALHAQVCYIHVTL